MMKAMKEPSDTHGIFDFEPSRSLSEHEQEKFKFESRSDISSV